MLRALIEDLLFQNALCSLSIKFAALSSCPAKIIYLSSTLVYGGNPISLPLTENCPTYPSGEYGFYKALCEDIVKMQIIGLFFD